MAVVTIHEAKTKLSELIRRVEAGEEIVIARGNMPVAVLKDFKVENLAARRRAGMNSLAGQISYADDSVWFGEMSDEDFMEAFGEEFFELSKGLAKADK